jgi:hypothetical protein
MSNTESPQCRASMSGMIRPTVAALLLLSVAAPAAHAADRIGMIEICRIQAAGDRHHGKAIPIPEGATFGDAGSMRDGQRSGNYWPLWIATLEPLTIAPEQDCVRARAKVLRNLDNRQLRVADQRHLVPSGTATNRNENWPADYDVAASVTADFR